MRICKNIARLVQYLLIGGECIRSPVYAQILGDFAMHGLIAHKSGVLLFAQAGSPDLIGSSPHATIMVLGILALAGAIVWWGIRHAAQMRQFEHAERMQALEAGRQLPEEITDNPDERFRRGAFWIAVLIGGLVPLAAVIAAGMCMIEVRAAIENSWFVFVIWSGAAAIAVAGVVSAAWLMLAAGQKAGSVPTASRQTTAYEARA